jgi:hypothetical protein
MFRDLQLCLKIRHKLELIKKLMLSRLQIILSADSEVGKIVKGPIQMPASPVKEVE